MTQKCNNQNEHSCNIDDVKSNMPKEEDIIEMGARFKTISEPSRLKILLALSCGELCVEHITESIQGNQSAVSHQLKVLKDNKIIKSRRQGQKILYSISDWHIMTIIQAAKEHLNCHD